MHLAGYGHTSLSEVTKAAVPNSFVSGHRDTHGKQRTVHWDDRSAFGGRLNQIDLRRAAVKAGF